MSIVNRRAFLSCVGAILGTISVPGIVKTALAGVSPENEVPEDFEEILQGLTKRFREIYLSAGEIRFVGSFFARFSGTHDPNLPWPTDEKKLHPVIRLWIAIATKRDEDRTAEPRYTNAARLKPLAIPHIIRVTKPTVDRMRAQLEETVRSNSA